MAKVQKGKLILGGYEFDVKNCEETRFFLFDDDGYDDDDEEAMTKTVSMDVWFKEGRFGDETVSPQIVINEFSTGRESLDDIIGMEFEVSDVEEADEREDTMYVFEHEPLVNYKWKILGREDGLIHVSISGTAITDGYSDPAKTAEFEGEFWLILDED